MFARCLLGRPGTGRQGTVLTSLRLAGLRYSSACHSISVTQVFRKVPLSSGLLIRGFGVQVPGGAHVLTWGFTAPGHFLCARFAAVVAPWLLARTDLAIPGLSKTAHPGADAWLSLHPDPAGCRVALYSCACLLPFVSQSKCREPTGIGGGTRNSTFRLRRLWMAAAHFRVVAGWRTVVRWGCGGAGRRTSAGWCRRLPRWSIPRCRSVPFSTWSWRWAISRTRMLMPGMPG